MDGYNSSCFWNKNLLQFKIVDHDFWIFKFKSTCVKPIENFDSSNTKQEVAFVEPSFGC